MSPIQTLTTTCGNIVKQVKKPDHPFWKKVGTIAFNVAQPLGSLAILAFVPAPYKDPAIALWIALCNAIKGATKLTVDPKAK